MAGAPGDPGVTVTGPLTSAVSKLQLSTLVVEENSNFIRLVPNSGIDGAINDIIIQYIKAPAFAKSGYQLNILLGHNNNLPVSTMRGMALGYRMSHVVTLGTTSVSSIQQNFIFQTEPSVPNTVTKSFTIATNPYDTNIIFPDYIHGQLTRTLGLAGVSYDPFQRFSSINNINLYRSGSTQLTNSTPDVEIKRIIRLPKLFNFVYIENYRPIRQLGESNIVNNGANSTGGYWLLQNVTWLHGYETGQMSAVVGPIVNTNTTNTSNTDNPELPPMA